MQDHSQQWQDGQWQDGPGGRAGRAAHPGHESGPIHPRNPVPRRFPVPPRAALIRTAGPGAALGAILLLSLLLSLGAGAARADLRSPDRSELLPLRDLVRHLWPGERPLVLEQRAIQEKKKPAEEPVVPEEEREGEEPGSPAGAEAPEEAPADAPAGATPPGGVAPGATSPGGVAPAKEVILAPTDDEETREAKSPARAFLLSAAVPGLGELYSGSNRGYLFLGVEAVSWITYASYRSSSNNKEDEMFEYADDHFSLRAFCDNCVGQPGQTCDSAVQTLVNFYETDRDEFYEIISKNPIYRSGWGVQVPGDNTGNCVVPSSIPGYSYENGDPPDPGGEDYREWIADQGANQDRAYAAYNELRDDRNSLSRTARGMTMVALVNHVVSAWDAFMAARGVNAVAHGFKAHVGRQIEMDLKVKGSIGNPGARFVLRRKF